MRILNLPQIVCPHISITGQELYLDENILQDWEKKKKPEMKVEC